MVASHANAVSGREIKNSVQLDITAPATDLAKQWNGWGTALKPAWEPIILAMKPLVGTFAKNAETHGVAGLNVDGCRIGDNPGYKYNADSNGTTFHGQQGERQRRSAAKKGSDTIESTKGRWPANVILDEDAGALLDEQSGASRFFYCAKAAKSEKGADNTHPTVKPLKLMEYLCRLTATPTGGIVLDPFCGSGSTLLAARNTGRDYVGIELNEEYAAIARQRLESREPLFV
jgi:site-specific DNA-methyltransferase (adenine-specific)